MAAGETSHFARLFHLICGIFYATTFYYDTQIPYANSYGGRWKFLTFLDLLFQLTYFISAFCVDVAAVVKGHRLDTKWTTLRDVFYAAVAFPFGVFVAATFWGIYFIDRDLIFPETLDKIVPPWLNHALHTWCAVLVIVEGAVVKHQYPRNSVALTVLLAVTLSYLALICWVAYAAKFWVYPFMRIMSGPAIGVFFAMCALILVIFYWMGKWMNKVIWGGCEESATKASNSSSSTKKKAKRAQ